MAHTFKNDNFGQAHLLNRDNFIIVKPNNTFLTFLFSMVDIQGLMNLALNRYICELNYIKQNTSEA